MSKTCASCGSPLKDNAKFCDKCGSPVVEAQNVTNQMDGQTATPVNTLNNTQINTEFRKTSSGKGNTIKKILKVVGIVIIAFFVLIFGLALKDVLTGKNAPKNTSSTVTQQSKKTESIESVLASFNIKGKVISSTYGNNPDGFMANLENKVYIVDLKNNQIATIENYSTMVRHVHKIRGRDNSSGNLIPQFLILNDKHGKDDQMGEWRGNNHFLPIYILVECDAAGNIKSRGKMSSGLGAAPSHYQGYLEEQKNIDIANLFLKNIITFMENPQNEIVNQGSYAKPLQSSPVYIGTINANEVNVRKGPGKEYQSLGYFLKGDKVRLVGETTNNMGENWYNIEYDNPSAGLIKGWVRKDFINYP